MCLCAVAAPYIHPVSIYFTFNIYVEIVYNMDILYYMKSVRGTRGGYTCCLDRNESEAHVNFLLTQFAIKLVGLTHI